MKIIRILIPALALLLGFEALSSAQVYHPEALSASQRRELINELYFADYLDHNLSTKEASDLKGNLQNFGNYLVNRGVTFKKIGYWGGLGGAMLCAIVGGATKTMPVVYGSAAFLVGGVVFVAIGMSDKSKGQTMLDHARMVVASSATYPLQMDNLALGISTTLNPVNHTVALGPAIAIRF